MDGIELIPTDAGNVSEYAFCGFKNPKQEGYRLKTEWLKKRYPQGLRFKILHSEEDGSVGAIEYIPGEYTWRAVRAGGYMFIHCIFIIPRKLKGLGYGAFMLEDCLTEARKEKAYGVAAVTRKGTWMAGKELFCKHGFEVMDEAPPDFELVVRKFRKGAPDPSFSGDWERKSSRYGKGLTIIKSDQCPAVAKPLREIGEVAESEYGLKPKIVEVRSCREAQRSPSAFGGVFSIIYNGKLLAYHPISKTRFKNIMSKAL